MMEVHNDVFTPVGGEMEVDKPQEDVKAKYKSWKKKYRKMRLQFEQRMNLSNSRYKQEQEAAETARRLALQIDHLLDLLLDVNESTHTPAHQSINLSLASRDSASAYPPLPTLHNAQDDTNGQAKSDQAVANDDALPLQKTNIKSKSLDSLMANSPHRPFTINSSLSQAMATSGASQALADDLEHPEPLGYLSPDRIDEHLASVDAILGLSPAPVFTNPAYVPTPLHLSDKDLAVRNPVSVYNWLRAHEPKIFLQDGESQALSEKSLSKPGALRGAGKRASIPAPSKADTVEFVEEDGIGYDVSLGGPAGGKDGKGATGKRKRPSDEDAGYRPKGGSSRPTKKKKKDGSGETPSSTKSSVNKAKGKSDAGRNIESTPLDAGSDDSVPPKVE